MTQKKRGKAKRSAGVASALPQLSSGRGEWILPALGALALILAWLAALGGAADGSIDWRKTFDHDSLRSYGVFRDLFGGEGYSAAGWGHGKAPSYFPDFAFQWALFALGVDLQAALYIFPLMQVGFAAAGWMLVCDFLFGKSPTRRAAVLLAHAATFLSLAWDESQIFNLQMVSVFHYGAWACVPWLLWLSMRMLELPRPHPGRIAALVLALAVITASNLLIAPWFTAPAALAVLLSARFKQCAVFIAVLAAGTVLGLAIDHAIPYDNAVSLKERFQYQASSVSRWVSWLHVLIPLRWHLAETVSRDPLKVAAMLAFAAALCVKLAPELRKFGAKKTRGEFRPRFFVLLLMPISIAVAVASQINHGSILATYLVHPITAMRYLFPMFFYPLFVGWALLEWKAPRWQIRPAALAAAACAAALALSVPKLTRIDFAALDPFATPFQKCFAENARRLEWTSGMAPLHFGMQMFANPDAGMENYNWIRVLRAEAGRSSMASLFGFVNHRRRGKEVQFVVSNARNGLVFFHPPRASDQGCPLNDYEPCRGWEETSDIITDRAVKGAFGEPAEIVECAGIGIYHYDPPLRFEFSDRPTSHIAVGNKF